MQKHEDHLSNCLDEMLERLMQANSEEELDVEIKRSAALITVTDARLRDKMVKHQIIKRLSNISVNSGNKKNKGLLTQEFFDDNDDNDNDHPAL